MNKNCNLGFSLIELLVYFSATTVLTLVTLQWLVSSHLALTRATKQCTRTILCCAAHDTLAHDLRALQAWKKVDDEQWIWACEYYDVGWHINDATLYRTQGRYDEYQQRWHDPTISIVAEHIQHLLFETDSIGTVIRSITCRLQSEDSSYDTAYTIALHGGMVI